MVQIQDVHVSLATMRITRNPKSGIVIFWNNPSKITEVQSDVVSYSCELHECEFGEFRYIVSDIIEQCHVLVSLKKTLLD
ncbi:hypothetical protein APY94_07060 [Thermococcus celericrescens]|uniref:Uncharacterized protein n=1 Tax=Thermococcus celericrescens TaxID=227598 RepID=A0A100XXP3_9EURY|nr:hypothetical protein APY94_07060 [Thermococcus celericrescens]